MFRGEWIGRNCDKSRIYMTCFNVVNAWHLKYVTQIHVQKPRAQI